MPPSVPPISSRPISPRRCAASGAEVLLCYLPVGSEQAVKHYAQACLDARRRVWSIAFPSSSRPTLNGRRSFETRAFRSSATTSRARSARRSSIARWRGCSPTGASASIGPTSSTPRATPIFSTCWSGAASSRRRYRRPNPSSRSSTSGSTTADIHIGPSDYIPWQQDNKVCFIRMEGRGFGDAPLEIELRMSVQDSLEQRRRRHRRYALRQAGIGARDLAARWKRRRPIT